MIVTQEEVTYLERVSSFTNPKLYCGFTTRYDPTSHNLERYTHAKAIVESLVNKGLLTITEIDDTDLVVRFRQATPTEIAKHKLSKPDVWTVPER